MATLLVPPTLHELLKDNYYNEYFHTPPAIPAQLTAHGSAWRVWRKVQLESEVTWFDTLHTTYEEAAEAASFALSVPQTLDAAVVSRRMSFIPPVNLTRLIPRGRTMDWCRRCRRPSSFQIHHTTHHALALSAVVSDDAAYRCYFCAGRRITFGTSH